jgi:hypothetical protein
MAEPQEPPIWEVIREGSAGGGPGDRRLIGRAQLADAKAFAALRRPLFPIYGLPPTRPGRRYIRGWRQTEDLVTAVELAVLEERTDTLVVVSSSPRRPWDNLSTDEEALRQLVTEVASTPEDLLNHDLDRRSLVLRIGENLVTFSCAVHGRISVLWSLHGPGILVQGRNVPPEAIELVALADAGPYLEGLVP